MSDRNVMKKLLLGMILVLLAACTSSPAETPPAATDPPPQITEPSAPATEGKIIVFGDISDDPGEVIEGTQPLVDYVAANLSDFGITLGQVKIAASADEMIQFLESGEVDLYFDSVYPATLISDASGAQPFLRRWRYGVEEYYTIIFASAESGITSIDDLPGHMIALDNAFSTSGFLLPAVYLIERDLNMVGKQAYGDSVADDEVGFVFSYDDENTLQWVLSGLVAAGATDDYHYNVAFPPDAREKLVLLTETESVPRQVVVARPGMDLELQNAIKQILITAHESKAGSAALEPFQTSRFDEFPEGIEAAQNRMREMMKIVQDIPMP
ncbi:MAG: phosphate/phosphite/phosphonate ABC transporter substrate-binding protein [Chloroflexi bacterium]|nr:phosphate/phosphite/phosphonate ABC transporter substrate-binding protein [Chloroflexota bacterium]